jgi:hypothetical protein
MDFERAEALFRQLAEMVDYPLFEDTQRYEVSATLAVTSMHFGSAVRVLCAERQLIGAATVLRSQFEAVVRSVWALHRATDEQLEMLSAELSAEAEVAGKKLPSVNAMMIALERFPQLAKLLVSLQEFKDSSWVPLNSFVHSGIHAVHWTRYESPPKLLDNVFRVSNGLNLLAYMHLGFLTGQRQSQAEMVAVTAAFSSCLPGRR